MNYDELIEAVGSNGRFQKRLYILLFLASVPNGWSALITVFTLHTPTFHCKILPANLNMSVNEGKMETMKNLFIPKKEHVYDSCSMYNVSFDRIMELLHSENMNTTDRTFHNSSTINCPNGHYYERDHPRLESAITEYGMVCDKAWQKPVVTSLYMAGVGVGSLLGKISDIYGRKKIFVIFTYTSCVMAGMNSLSWNIFSYGLFMFISGISNSLNFVAAVIISCEFMNVEDRSAMSLGPFLAFSTGYTFSSFLGYLISNWRWLYRIDIFLLIGFISYFWLIPESPRWLISKGRVEEAKQILEQVARINGRKVDVQRLMDEGVILENSEEKKTQKGNEETLGNLLRNKSLRIRLFVSCCTWLVLHTVYKALACYPADDRFAISLVYYTIALNTSGLAGNRFINCLLVAAVEFPAYTVGFLCIKYFGRPSSQAVLMGIGGVCCITAPFLINPTLTVVLAMIGKFAITSEFFIVYIYQAELTPTLFRNFSVGLGSFSARISAFLAPYLIFAGESIHKALSFLMMGVLSILTSILTIIFLPETRGVPLPENVEDALKNKNYTRFLRRRKHLQSEEKEDVVI